MDNQMPTMNAKEGEVPSLEVENNAEEVEKNLPTSEPGLPSFASDEISHNEKEVEVPVTGNNSIEVVALRKGFYNQRRIKEGKVFKVKNFNHLGTWTKCTDPVIEKQRLAKFNKKKANK